MRYYVFSEFNEMVEFGDEGNWVPDVVSNALYNNKLSFGDLEYVCAYKRLQGNVPCLKSLWKCAVTSNLDEYIGKKFVLFDFECKNKFINENKDMDDKEVTFFKEIPLDYLAAYSVCEWSDDVECWHCYTINYNESLIPSLAGEFFLGEVPHWFNQIPEDYQEDISQKICPRYYYISDALYACKKSTASVLELFLKEKGIKESDYPNIRLSKVVGDETIEDILNRFEQPYDSYL